MPTFKQCAKCGGVFDVTALHTCLGYTRNLQDENLKTLIRGEMDRLEKRITEDTAMMVRYRNALKSLEGANE